ELRIPHEVAVPSAQCIHLFAVGKRQRKILDVALEIKWFVTEDVTVHQCAIDDFAIVEASYCHHHGTKWKYIALLRSVPRINAEIGKRELGFEDIFGLLAGKQKILFTHRTANHVAIHIRQLDVSGPDSGRDVMSVVGIEAQVVI